MQIDEPGANAGTKHRIKLPPAYRQFNDDGEAKQFHKYNEKMERENGDRNGTLVGDAKHLHTTEEKRKELIKIPGDTKSGEKTKKKSRKVRSLFSNYFMSRRRFYKLMESQMDR